MGTPILYLKAGPEAFGAASLFGIGPAPTFPCHCGASLGAKPQSVGKCARRVARYILDDVGELDTGHEAGVSGLDLHYQHL